MRERHAVRGWRVSAPYRIWRTGFALCYAALAIALMAAPAEAARKKDSKETSKHVLNQKDAKKLGEVHELLQNDQWEEARAILDTWNLERAKPYPFTLVHQAYGFIEANNENYEKAAEHFAAALSTDTLPPSQQLSTRFNLGQIYMMLDDWDRAVDTLNTWFQESEQAQPIAYYMLAVAYYQGDHREKALEPARMAVETAKDPRETWMQLLLSIYMENKQYQEALPLLERLVLRFEKPVYWTRLAAVLMELERDQDSLAVQQLAYAKGYLETSRAITRLVQTYAFAGMPWQGAQVMQESLEKGTVESDKGAWRLYANSLLAARETDMALEPLEQAAELSEDGEVYIQLSQVYIQNERWTDALAALDRAFAKGDLDNPGHAYLLVGIAAYQVKRLGQARSAFAQALDHEKTRDMAERWLQFVAREEAARAS